MKDRSQYFKDYYRKIRRPRQIAKGGTRQKAERSVVISLKVQLSKKALWELVAKESGAAHLSTFIREAVDYYAGEVSEYAERQGNVTL